MKYTLLVLSLLSGAVFAGTVASGGFETSIDKAFTSAKRFQKPLLIDFYGIWCPPCNQLDEEVFESPAFQIKARAFQLLKVDVDAETSWKLKDRYKVGGYPTIIFTNTKGDELYRIVGYRTLKEFQRAMDIALAAKGTDARRACQSKQPDELYRCALICSERKDKGCAQQAYSRLQATLKRGTVRYEEARTFFAENAATEDLKRDGYEKLLAEFPQSPRALMWAGDYLALSFFEVPGAPAPKKELVERVLAESPRMATDSRLEEMGLAVSDVLELRAELLDKLGRRDESRGLWKEAAANLAQRITELPKGSPARGFVLERIGCLQAGADTAAALALANEYRTKYPGEFTFHFAAARVLDDAKRYNEALPLAQQALTSSYGDNRIWVATLLVTLLGTVPDKEGARKIYNQVTSEIRPGSELEVRTHRYLKKLDQAWDKVRGSAKS